MILPIEGSLNYLAILIMLVIALIIATVIVQIAKLTGVKTREVTPAKYDTYECGVGYEGSAHQQFSVRYYLVGIIFLIFDVEVVFMYPWTLTFKNYIQSGPVILLEMGLFMLLVLGGYFYLRLRGAFKWD